MKGKRFYLITLNIYKDNVHYVVETISKRRKEVVLHTKESLYESLYKLGRSISINNVHFHIPQDLSLPLLSFLSIEYPGELYEHRITITD